MDYDNYDAIIHYIWTRTQGSAWFKPSTENISLGICLRVDGDPPNVSRNDPSSTSSSSSMRSDKNSANTNRTTNPNAAVYRVFPYDNPYLAPFEAAIRELNPLVAVKIRSAAVNAALASVSEDATAIFIDSDTRIQILDSMIHLGHSDKEQCSAFLRDEKSMIIWSDSFNSIVPHCRELQKKITDMVWKRRREIGSYSQVSSPLATPMTGSRVGSRVNVTGIPILPIVSDPEKAAVAEELVKQLEEAASTPAATTAVSKEKKKSKWWKFSSKSASNKSDTALEKGEAYDEVRPVRLYAGVYTGFAAGLSIFFTVNGLSTLLQEWRLDGDFKRFALLAAAPFLLCVSLFFSLQIVSSLSFIFGPITQYHENSKYYSAVPPPANPEIDSNLPHVTIELPVYKESLEETIKPSVESIKQAMQTYARQGGTSTILIHDDGLQLLKDEERLERINFYRDHNIGWVARPPHKDHEGGFKRAGRFKKASNMNFGLALSLRLEKKIAQLEEQEKRGYPIDGADEKGGLEEVALEMVIEEMWAECGRKEGWKPWANNAKSLRVGGVILIVDADTLVPEDCFRSAARELYATPELAIIQHESDVMQVAHHYFENGITHFTRRINKCISMSCANGEVAPFVGHNAFLKWSAIQDAAFLDPDMNDGGKLKSKIWSESNVSEDFDMALRLQLKGYIIRWATYSDGGFKEGVSLTVDDELNRWQKYSYGCNELLFNPLKSWPTKGPITSQLFKFLHNSPAPIHYKLSMMAYMFSYYGIAAAASLAILNYFLLGWAAFDIDGYYMHSFEIWLACVVVFPGLGNFGYTILEYRLGIRSLLPGFWENFRWVPFFFFFFGGLSIHLSTALLAHLFSYNMTWSATKKEVERSNFFKEVPRVWSRFWPVIISCLIFMAGIGILSSPLVPLGWAIGWTGSWGVIVPLLVTSVVHILFPVVLNPWLMVFSY